jgi:predicted CXXCH cytochrome family protein
MNQSYLRKGIWQRVFRPASLSLLSFAVLLGASNIAPAVIISNVSATKHNLSASSTGTVKATSQTQICVFCHTPHGADQSAGAPLWNHALSNATYTPYFSLSMDANPLPGPPGASSKVCLSCHDGTLAVGTVGALEGKSPVAIAMNGTGINGVMPNGSGATTGYTRNLGIDLSNDHPISFNYDTALGGVGGTDGELRTSPVVNGGITVVGNRTASVKPTFPLENNQVQCITCHDPHFFDTVSTNPPLKFLRGNRLQQATPLGGLYVPSSDITCVACHDKGGVTWSNSAHSNQLAADETYLDAAATTNEFPLSTPVWQASCVSCHDTHTVQGSRRLLREGTDSLASPKSGGNPAIEQTCYQCHSPNGTTVLSQISPTNIVPDIKSDFTLPIHMPISAQPETHNIGGNFDDSTTAGVGHLANGTSGRCNTAGDQCGKDFMESEAVLGKVSAGGSPANRHAECTDCHNPHRATKNRLFNADSAIPDVAGTHKHLIVAGDTVPHSNIASGSLRGINGVEPTYSSSEFGFDPSSFTVKRGDGGTAASNLITSAYVTREYQICLKCHSNYAYDNSPEALGYSGGTFQNTNGFLNYINNAMEFQAPATHTGAPASTTDSGAFSPTYAANNYRSWHPVMGTTGRTSMLRGNASPNLWRSPWNGSNTDGGTTIVPAVGSQTMYCSDCHGSHTNLADGVVPVGGENGSSWGPHGSTDNFLLKGEWKTDTIPTVANDTLCFRCHNYSQYADPAATPVPAALPSGFGGSGTDFYGAPISNLHQRHAYYTTQGGTPNVPVWPASANGALRCTMCHTGTAHGWKNKAFLVNLNDLGPELNKISGGMGGGALGGEIAPGPVTLTVGANVPKGTYVPSTMAPIPTGYSNGPYYRGALQAIAATGFKASGTWVKADCTGCH